MPMIPQDLKKCRERTKRELAERKERAGARERQAAEAEASMHELRDKFAREQGIDPSDVTVIMCQRGGRE